MCEEKYIDAHVHPLIDPMKIIKEADNACVDKLFLLATEILLKKINDKKVRERLRRISEETFFLLDLEIYRRLGVSDIVKALEMFYEDLLKSYPEARILSEDVLEIWRIFPDRIVPIGSIDPDLPEDLLMKRLKELYKLGIKGIKLLPTLQLFDPEDNDGFEIIMEFAEKNKLIMIIHTGCDPGPFEIPALSQWANPLKLERVLERYSPTTILAHIGSYCAYRYGIWFNEALRILKKFDNVYADTSAVNDFIFYEERIVKKIREEIGFERILFGSDYPVVLNSTIKEEIDLVLESPYINDYERHLILRENAEKILKEISRDL